MRLVCVCVCKTASYLAKSGRVATNEVVKSIGHAPIATNIHWYAPIVACKCCLELLLDNGQRSLDSLLDLLHCSRRVCNWWRGTCTSTRARSCSRCCCSSCWWHGGSCWNSCCCCCCCGCHGVCVSLLGVGCLPWFFDKKSGGSCVWSGLVSERPERPRSFWRQFLGVPVDVSS